MEIRPSYDPDEVARQVEINLRRDIDPVPFGAHNGILTICGNGPSLWDMDIPKGQPVAALNGALGVLLKRGITPDFSVVYDPRKENVVFFREAPRKTRYLIASRAHPSVFRRLSERKVNIWHVLDEDIEAGMGIGDRLIAGGGTVGLKAPVLMYALGFKAFDLIGYDCCLGPNDEHHASPQPWDDGREILDITVNGQRFRAYAWMIAQAKAAIEQFTTHPYPVRIHGDGLLATLERARHEGPVSIEVVEPRLRPVREAQDRQGGGQVEPRP